VFRSVTKSELTFQVRVLTRRGVRGAFCIPFDAFEVTLSSC